MKKNIIRATTVLILILALAYCLMPSTEDKILKKAIHLERSTNQSLLVKLKKLFRLHKAYVSDHFLIAYKKDNLSYFLISIKPIIPKEYEITIAPPEILVPKFSEYVQTYETACTLKDITKQQWKWDGDNFSGSFSFKTPYEVSGRCLFEGKNNKIEKMFIARADSDKLEDGYGVFGCEYGHSIFSKFNFEENKRE